jgi:hypothetical protein
MENNYLFIYRREKPVLIKAISGTVFLMAIYRILHSPISSIAMGLGSIGVFAYQSGIEINSTDRKYRIVSILGPQMFGKWEEFPELDYISLFKTNITFTTRSLTTASVSQTDTFIQVNLITKQKKKIKAFEGKDVKEAIAKAKQLSTELNLDIWNATIKPADWYEEEPTLD